MRRRLLCAMALLAAACGDGSRPTPPVAPAPQPTPQVLTVLSGETGGPVTGAHVNAGGQQQTTDAAGRVTVGGGMLGSTLVDVVAEGFFDRQTLLSRAGAPYTLWPRTSATGLDEQATGQIVYTSSIVGLADPPFAQDILHRWAPGRGPVEVVLEGPGTNPAYREFSPGAQAVQAEAVAAINDALGGRLVLQAPVVRDGAPATDRIVVRIFPEVDTCANFDIGAFANWTAPTIRQATITYCSARGASTVTLAMHELGHTLGFRHSGSSADIMFSAATRAQQPSPRERLLLALMYQRLPGNRFPDNDRSATAGSERAVEVRCW